MNRSMLHADAARTRGRCAASAPVTDMTTHAHDRSPLRILCSLCMCPFLLETAAAAEGFPDASQLLLAGAAVCCNNWSSSLPQRSCT